MDEATASLHAKLRKAIQEHLEGLGVSDANAAFILYQVDAGTRGYLLLASERSKRVLEERLRQAFGLKPQGVGLWVLLNQEASMIVDAWTPKALGPAP